MNQVQQTTSVKLPSNINLLNLYKVEKEQMDLPSNPFPSFKDWKADYMIEFIDSHSDSKMVDAETAVDITEKELNDLEKKQTKSVKIKKVVDIKIPKKSTEPKVKKVKGESKKDKAVAIYKEMMDQNEGKHPARKDVIKRFMDEVNLSSAGASTYQYNIKKELS